MLKARESGVGFPQLLKCLTDRRPTELCGYFSLSLTPYAEGHAFEI